jgi:hypothetical protein
MTAMTKKTQENNIEMLHKSELRAAYDTMLINTGLMYCQSQFDKICEAYRQKTTELLSKNAQKPPQLTPEQFVFEYMDRPGEHILNKLQTSGLYTFAFEKHQVGLDADYALAVTAVPEDASDEAVSEDIEVDSHERPFASWWTGNGHEIVVGPMAADGKVVLSVGENSTSFNPRENSNWIQKYPVATKVLSDGRTLITVGKRAAILDLKGKRPAITLIPIPEEFAKPELEHLKLVTKRTVMVKSAGGVELIHDSLMQNVELARRKQDEVTRKAIRNVLPESERADYFTEPATITLPGNEPQPLEPGGKGASWKSPQNTEMFLRFLSDSVTFEILSGGNVLFLTTHDDEYHENWWSMQGEKISFASFPGKSRIFISVGNLKIRIDHPRVLPPTTGDAKPVTSEKALSTEKPNLRHSKRKRMTDAIQAANWEVTGLAGKKSASTAALLGHLPASGYKYKSNISMEEALKDVAVIHWAKLNPDVMRQAEVACAYKTVEEKLGTAAFVLIRAKNGDSVLINEVLRTGRGKYQIIYFEQIGPETPRPRIRQIYVATYEQTRGLDIPDETKTWTGTLNLNAVIDLYPLPRKSDESC